MSKFKKTFELTYPNAAGIDIGASSHFAAVPADRDEQPVREFASFTEDLHALADWLAACGINAVAVGVTSMAYGTGLGNTTAINAKCSAGTAASIAASYSLNGFSDWHLPSKDELNLLYEQKTVVGGFSDYYWWSSSEVGSSAAWVQEFDYGSQGGTNKNLTLPVRAVRAF
jgi:hypothetical protein